MPDTIKNTTGTKVAFGDVVQLSKERSKDPQADGFERYIGLEHLESSDLKVQSWGDLADGVTFTNVFRPGQVLFGKRRAYQRKVAVADFSGVCSGDIYVLEPKGEQLLPELLPFICQSEPFYDYVISMSQGGLSPRVNWKALEKYEFALPPLEEQRRIAEVLLAFEHSLVSLGDACESTRLAHQSACRWLGDALSKSPETQWTTIGELGDVRMGRQRSPKYQTGKHTTPYLRVANVFDGYIDTSDVLEMDFNERDFATYLLRDGDILLNEGQSRELVGRSAIYRGEVPDCCFQNTLIRFRSESVLPDFAQTFFRYWLYTGKFIAASKQTTSIAHLGLKRFVQMKFPVLNKEAQSELVAPVLSLESAFTNARKRKSQISDMKQSVLDQVLRYGRCPA
jgi:type I restriction enzyme, S subunit